MKNPVFRHILSVPLYAIYFLIELTACTSSPDTLEIVKTDAGPVSGTTNQEGDVYIFKGIPFAAPPTGASRWKAPQPVKPWTNVRQCTAFGPSPMQNEPAPFSMWTEEFLIPKEPISEDCLYLNVWTGAKTAGEKRPVIVWIYGGGFVSGGSAVPIYDGEAMAKQGIVFVSINYRVGIFGFFAHAELSRESGHQTSGNYGLMDQLAALQWVQKNIAAFGGDPDNITIAGQSAGAMSVNCLVGSPLSEGLFHKAIAQSGASFTRDKPSLQEAEEKGEAVAQSLQATSLADLRNTAAEDLLKVEGGIHGPIIDGYVLPESVVDIFEAGKQQDVALLTGWNEDEGLVFGSMVNSEVFRQHAQERYGEEAEAFLSHYPATDDSVTEISQLKFSRDRIFGVHNFAWTKIQSEQAKSKVYVYRFTRKVPATGDYVRYGAFHTGEVPYAYDNLEFVDRTWEPVDYELAHAMSSYWVNFITDGDPNGKDLPLWPAYETQEQRIIKLGKTIEAISLPDKEALDFLYEQMIME